MFRLISGALTALTLSAAASAFTPQEEMASRCVAEGNDPAQCACAAEVIVDTLEDHEVAFMMAMMNSGSEEPEQMLTVAAEHGLDMSGVVAIGQKMAAAEPEMRRQCGIEDEE
ncbi:hypothetical protein [Hyphobacterium sp.]|jgi:hypothetical protein|uniref:hypothetical protein n=1 Tax=Hyphobacterium sp. TaxID=2004662 RepID=UPI003BA89AF2